jgi:ABC-type branched-subunit amino acid transport system ATPase component/ABC-type branched-subunit amino acid transport system permease subunit
LSAAIVGRFQYLAPAAIGGVVIGMLQSDAIYAESAYHWLPSSGLDSLVPLAVILVVLVIKAPPLTHRGMVITQELGKAPRPQNIPGATALGLAAGVVLLMLLTGQWRTALVVSMIFSVISLSWVVITGYAGQISLMQLSLAGVAGFLLGPLTTSWHIPFPVAPLFAALAATVVGVLFGLPALRLRGMYLAIVTLALAVALQTFWFQNSDFVSSSGVNIAGPTLFGVNLLARHGVVFPTIAFSLLVLVILALVAVGVAMLRRSRLGSAMLAVRANERSAAAAGVNVVRTKILAFAISAFIAGIGGCLLAYEQSNVTVDSFDVILGLGVFATAYLGGITSVLGGVQAGFLAVYGLAYVALNTWLNLGGWYQVITGVGLILTVILNPEGIVSPIHKQIQAVRERRARRRVVPVDTSTAAEPRPPRPVRLRPAQAPALLSVDDVEVRYGGVTAVSGVSLEVGDSEIVGLIGPNGAGKTTLVDALTGFVRCSGRVRLDGVRLDGRKAHDRAQAGLARTFQSIELWDDLTVTENVTVGLRGTDRGDARLDRTLDLLHLSELRDRPAGDLSQGQRQLVSIARALVSDPKVLVLDEPAGGLDTTESGWLGERLRDIRASGKAILLIDHDMSLVLAVCDRIVVMDLGEIIANGSPDKIRSDRAVAKAYLGTTHAVGRDAGIVEGPVLA